jgi:hypothetical protein
MKRSLLAAVCVLLLLLAGCTAVNQTNSFAVNPAPETVSRPEITATPEVTVIPEVTATPETTQLPVVQLEIQPTPAPGTTDKPPTVTPTATPATENKPGGFNG